MRDFMNKNSKLVKIILSIGLIAVLLSSVIGLNILIQRHATVIEKQNQEKATRLNIAVVNEDTSVVSENETYNLGASYVKNIERDNSHNWSVVSRGTADSGLDSGEYQLAIYIPSNFSSKILDINSPAVEKTIVGYKVNANGNLQVESEANKKAKDIVADLNSQLVDMYIASILSNLYTAQQNVETVANSQGENIAQFENDLHPASTAFPNTLPALVSLSNNAVTTNSSLVSSLSSYSTLYAGLQSGQNDFGKNLTTLIEQRSADKLSYAAFVAALMDMGNNVLSKQTAAMIQQLQDQQAALTTSIGQSANDKTKEPASGYAQTIATVDGQITELLKQMANSKKKLQAKTEQIDVLAEEILKEFYKDKPNLDELTVQDMVSDSSTFKVIASDYSNQVNQLIIQSLNQLPSLDAVALSSQLNLLGDKSSGIQFDANVAKYYEKSYVPNTVLKDRLDKAYTRLQTVSTAKSTSSSTPTEAEITVSNPTGLILQSWKVIDDTTGTATTLAANETTKIDLSHAYRFEFQLEVPVVSSPAPNPGDATAPVDSGTPAPASAISVMTLQGKPIATTATTTEEEYRLASVEYASVVQEVIDAYNNAGRLLNLYHPDGTTSNLTAQFLKQPAKAYLLSLIKKGVAGSFEVYKKEIENDAELTKAVDNLEANRDSLTTKYVEVQKTNNQLSQDVSNAVALVDNLKQQSQDLQKLESQYSQGSNQTDSGLTNLSSSLQSLMSMTQGVADSSEANTKQAESVNATFESFNKVAEDAKTSADTLSTEADRLLTSFKDEMAKTQDFATSFEAVFANAYKDGVPNEALLEFMSSPVISEASSVKKTANAYRPFTWILLLEVITLFTAYLFATHNLVKKMEDRFKTNRWDDTDVMNVTVLTVLALAIGLVLGIVSSQQLQVESGLVPTWIFVIVLFSIVLVQGQYFLLKNFKSIGMGFILYTMISFVYLSSALGITATLKGLPATLKSFNILSILENQLFAYFDGHTVGVGLLVILFVVAIVLNIINIFVNLPVFLQKRNGEEIHA